MKKRKQQSGSTREQLVIPGLEVTLFSVASEDSRKALGKNTYDPTWDLTNTEKYD